MRGLATWILVAAGIVLVLLVTVAIGTGEDSGETVTAGEWAQTTCGAVGVWRGAMEDDRRGDPDAERVPCLR